MGTTHYASVLGLGFGDCGKGLFVDALTRRWTAHTVVRFSGGAQAGHNVIAPQGSPTPGLHHTFSQFGASTLVPGTRTVLLDPMIVHPTALLREAECLGSKGIGDALARLTIDGRCRLTTPYHQAAGRLREFLRGAAAHGTCGVGVGETVRHSLNHPALTLRYADLAIPSNARRNSLRDQLQAIRETLLADLVPRMRAIITPAMHTELELLQDAGAGNRWLATAQLLARQCPPATIASIHAQLSEPGVVLFEGAQGILLDEWRGFHPHTTWSTVTTQAVETAAGAVGLAIPIEHFGVLRTYATRHGHGPLPTHDPELDARLPEPHNSGEGWQGAFRRGHPDAVLLRYAIEAVGHLSGLLISHLDVFTRGIALRWCGRYQLPVGSGGPTGIASLRPGAALNLEHQQRMGEWLCKVRPDYDAEPVDSEAAFVDRLALVSDLPVVARGTGPTAADVLITPILPS